MALRFRTEAMHRRYLAIALSVVFLMTTASVDADAQTGGAAQVSGNAQPSALDQVQQLTVAEQNALDANDSEAILSTGRRLGALALRLLGDLYAAQGRGKTAGEAYSQSLAIEPNPGTLMQLASVRHNADDLPGTIAALTQAAGMQPQFGPVHLALGAAYWELNEYGYNSDSLHEFAEAQRLSPEDLMSNLDLGSILSQYQRYNEAAVYLRAAAAADPASPDPWLQLGMNAYAQERTADAAAALKQMVALTGVDVARNSYQIHRVYAVLSRIEAGAGHDAEAARYAGLAEQVHAEMLRNNVAAPLSESTGMIASGMGSGSKPTAAGPPADAATHATPEQQELEKQLKAIVAKSLNDAGTVLARNRDYIGALPLFLQASVADPSLPPVMRNLGLAAFHTGDYAGAITAFNHALQQNPDDTMAHNYLEQSHVLLSSGPDRSKP